MSKALITGGAGFIGSHLAEFLLNKNFSVSIIDNLSTGSLSNIETIKNHPKFKYVIEDIFNEYALRELIDEADVVFHLAAAVGVQNIIKNPVKSIETNISGTEKVLKYSAIKKKKVIIASTSEVYGKSDVVPFREGNDLVLGPTSINRWSYACSKAMDEFLALAYYKERNLPVVISRFFNTVGPRQVGRYGMVVPRFIKRALTGQPLIVYGDGKQSRCFTYVADAIKAIYLLSEKENCIGQVFNIGNPEEISINDLAKKIIRLANSKSEIKHIDPKEVFGDDFEDMKRRVPNIDKLKKFTGFIPTHNLDKLLELTVEYQKKKLTSDYLDVDPVKKDCEFENKIQDIIH